MRNLLLSLLLISSLLFGLSACHSIPALPLSPTGPTVAPSTSPTNTPFPTPEASIIGEELAERLTLIGQIQPQAGAVANNRVEALIQIHDFSEAYTAALDDSIITLEELAFLIQLAANARASLYSTGQPDMIQVANTAGWLLDLAAYGDWETANAGIRKFQRSLPRKPSL